jgi:alkylation response protein AidB-like acyl-CoA dehydrogenase
MTENAIENETKTVLRAHAEKAEQADRPAAESLDALRKEGVFALRTPRAHGGAWASAETIARTLAGLGMACPSTAWIAGTCVVSKNIAARCLPESSAREFFADPNVLTCGNGTPSARGERVPEGVRVSGRWPSVSGCEDAAWAGLALMMDGAYCSAVIPVAGLSVERTWHMAGMCATGSHTLVADDLLVPADRVVELVSADRLAQGIPPFAFNDILLYRVMALGPVIGAAQGALDAVNAMFASDRRPSMTTYSRMGESPGARHWLAEATHLVNRAERTMLSAARAVDSDGLSPADGPRLAMDLADASRDCRAAVERMLDLYGASGFNTANHFQRFWRDVAVASRQPLLNLYLATETYGTALAAHP